MRRFLACFLLVLCSGSLLAAIDSYEFQNEEQRERYQQLAEELRCPKCQNQNLADSDSQIATDLRRELYAQLMAGKSDEAIVEFMRERYGDFVLYKPRLQRNTWLLWFGPLCLIALVVAFLSWQRYSASRSGVQVGGSPAEAGPSGAALPTRPALIEPQWINVASLAVLLAIAVGSFWLYQREGGQRALQLSELGNRVFSGRLPDAELPVQQRALLVGLDEWLHRHPDDERFLYMRARLLSEMALWERAINDYRTLLARFPDQDNLQADFAQVLFLQSGRTLGPEAGDALKRALQLNPHNVTALGLLGMYAFEQGDYTSAAGFWERLLPVIPADSAHARTLAAGIARARELGGLPAVPAATAPAEIRLAVQLTLPESVPARPDEVVYVFLRPAAGSRMPLAVARTTVAALAAPVQLDTATSPMRGQVDLAAVEAVEVVARLSRSGQPTASPGDWEASSGPMSRHALPAALTLQIDQPIVAAP